MSFEPERCDAFTFPIVGYGLVCPCLTGMAKGIGHLRGTKLFTDLLLSPFLMLNGVGSFIWFCATRTRSIWEEAVLHCPVKKGICHEVYADCLRGNAWKHVDYQLVSPLSQKRRLAHGSRLNGFQGDPGR